MNPMNSNNLCNPKAGLIAKKYNYFYRINKMTTFIKMKFNKSDDQTNIDNIE